MPHLNTSIHCPSCNNQKVQRLPLAYEQNRSKFHFTSYSLKGGLILGEGHQATGLAQRLAPPIRENPGMKWIIIGGLGCMASLLLHSLIGIIGSALLGSSTSQGNYLVSQILVHSVLLSFLVILIYSMHRDGRTNQEYDRTIYQPNKEKWNRSYFCNRCGDIFDP